MRDNLRRAVAFAREAAKLPEVLQVSLFGSVARGEDTPSSDIDVAVVYARESGEAEEALEAVKGERIQLTHLTLARLAEEPSLAGALSGEGLLLHGRPVSLGAGDIALRPMVLIAYDMSGLAQPAKMRIRRALHGGVSRSAAKGREYVSRARGVASEAGVERVADGVLLADPGKAPRITGALRQNGARWREWCVWAWTDGGSTDGDAAGGGARGSGSG